jgi:hypothetical protein
LLLDLGSIFTSVMGWVGDVTTEIVTNPVLLLSMGFFVVGGVVGIFGRLIRR